MIIQDKSHELLCEVVRCAEVSKAMGNVRHPCSTVVGFQKRFKAPFQPPTPWVGHLGQAPVLFVGSNPSIGGREFYPAAESSDEDLIDFFDGAFDGPQAQIKSGIHALQADGEYGAYVRTWAGIRGRAKELLKRSPDPGLDYAIAEIVRCRSWNEIGVSEARDHCADLYLEQTVALSPALVIVALGSHVRDWLRNRWDLERSHVSEFRLEGIGRLVAFLPHPTAYGPKTFESIMPDELPRLQAAIKAK